MSDALDEIWVLGTRGLPVGAAVMEPSALKEWLQSTAALLPSPETDKDASMAVQDISEPHREPALRRRAAAALLRRLRIQESRLSDGSLQPFLDAGLEFALIDLPQWPLMTRSIEWMELNRERALRAVRDYRRRLERILEEG
jgi:hypothetical protein